MIDPATASAGGIALGVGGAIKEIGKQAAPVVAGCLQKLLGPASEELGEGLGLLFRNWKLGNAAQLDAKVAKIVRGRGLQNTVLPKSFLLPLIEEAVKTDDDGLLDMWAKLIAAGIESDDAKSPIYRQTLAMFSPASAKAFETLMSLYVDWRAGFATSGAAKNNKVETCVPHEQVPESVSAHKHEFLTTGIIHDRPVGMPVLSNATAGDYAVTAYANRLAKHLHIMYWPAMLGETTKGS